MLAFISPAALPTHSLRCGRSLRPHIPRPHTLYHTYRTFSRRPAMCEEPMASPSPSSDDSQRRPPPPQHSDISVSTAVSSASQLNNALAEATSRALANLSPGGPPHLAIIFVSVRYSVSNVGQSGRHSMDLVVPRLRALIPALKAVVGCTTDGVIGTGPTRDVVELDDAPAVSLTLMRLPRISVTPFHVMPDDLPSLDARQDAWQALVGRPKLLATNNAAFMVFSDPAFADRRELDRFLSGIEYAYPSSSVVGSLASTGAAFASGHLFCTLPRDVLNAEATSLRDSGLVGVSLSGDVQLDCLVSSGCRAIGPEFEVRKAAPSNTILELELVGRPSSSLSAVGQLQGILSYAAPEERALIRDNLHVGISADQFGKQEDNYIIRRVHNVDISSGGISLAQSVRIGHRVRFFVKEAETARKTLDASMQKYKRVELANSLVGYSNPPFGAMVFVDAGRGRSLFREPMMETRKLSSFAPGVPIAGSFTGGQIGPSQTGPEGNDGPAVLHNAANLIALVRRQSGMSPSEPIDSPSTSSADVDENEEKGDS